MNGKPFDEERRCLLRDHVSEQNVQLQRQQQQLVQQPAPTVGDIVLCREVIEERAEAIEQIAQDVEQVSDIMRLLQYMVVEEQGPMVERVEDQIDRAAINTERGTHELVTAERYHKRRARMNKTALKTLLLIGGGALVGTGAGVVAGSALLGIGVGIVATTGSAAISMKL